MRNSFSKAAALALCLAAAPAFADDGNFFINGSLGQSDYHLPSSARTNLSKVDRQDNAAALRLGYRWNSVVDYGVELGYAYLGKAKGRYETDSASYHDRTKMHGWTLGGKLNYDITPNWFVSARAGWIRAHNNVKVSYDTPVVDGAVSRSTTRTGEYFGAGVGYTQQREGEHDDPTHGAHGRYLLVKHAPPSVGRRHLARTVPDAAGVAVLPKPRVLCTESDGASSRTR